MELHRKRVLQPTDRTFEAAGVCNPCCVRVGDVTHMFYRAISRSRRSVIGYCQLDGQYDVRYRSPIPALDIELDIEINGLEDPKIVRVGDEYCLLYHAFGRHGVVTAYATSPDLRQFTKKGILKPLGDYRATLEDMRDERSWRYYAELQQEFRGRAELLTLWGKDLVLFPRKIGGRFAALHRVPPLVFVTFFDAFEQLTPAFWSARSETLMDDVVLAPEHWFETRALSASAAPVEVDEGWLTFFHSVEATPAGSVYRASAALLDRDNPRKTLGRLPEPLFSPTHEWEQRGIVNNAVYVSSALVTNDEVHVYYGAADSSIGVAVFDRAELLRALQTGASSGTMT